MSLITVTNTGTLTATGSEQTLGAAKTTSNIWVAQVDLINMAAGDIVEIRAYLKVLTGSTEHIMYLASFSNAQNAPVIQTPAIPSPYSIKFTLKQPAGGGYRNFDYAIMSLA